MRWWKILLMFLLLLAVAGGGFGYWRWYQGQHVPETLTVAKQTVEHVVEFKGHIEAKKVVKLGFERSGIVNEVNVGVGDVVAVGEQLAKLDTRATELDVTKAIAARASARDAAKVDLNAAQAAQNKTKAEYDQTLEQKRQAVRNAKASLDQAQEVYQQTARASGDEAVATKAAYADVLTAKAAYNAAQKALDTAQKTADTANQAASDSVSAAQEAYAATVRASGSVAGLSAAEADEAQAQVQLTKDTLTAPIAGTVTAVDVEEGEVETAGQALIVVQTTDRKEVTADVDETDIAFVRPGAQAAISFDAYPGESWQAQVTKLDPVGKIEDENVTYKATMLLDKDDERLLPALTARVTIMAGKKTDVVAVPELALEKSGSDSYAYVVSASGATVRKKVTLGMTGTNGLVEVVDGLNEGETILRRPLEK